jgi:hypothetical protein
VELGPWRHDCCFSVEVFLQRACSRLPVWALRKFGRACRALRRRIGARRKFAKLCRCSRCNRQCGTHGDSDGLRFMDNGGPAMTFEDGVGYRRPFGWRCPMKRPRRACTPRQHASATSTTNRRTDEQTNRRMWAVALAQCAEHCYIFYSCSRPCLLGSLAISCKKTTCLDAFRVFRRLPGCLPPARASPSGADKSA